MIKYKIINQETYQEFQENYNDSHFMQTLEIGKRVEITGNKLVHLGFYLKEELVGVIQLTSTGKLLSKHRYISYMAPLLDYKNLELTSECLAALRTFFDDQKVLSGIISPNISSKIIYPNEINYSESKRIEKILTSHNFDKITDYQLSLIYPNYFFKKDLSQFKNYGEVLKSFSNETRRIIENNKHLPLTVTEVGKEDLNQVVDILDETAERKSFFNRGTKYYESLYRAFEDSKHKVMFLKVVLDVQKYKDNLKKEIKEFESKIASDASKNSKKSKNRVVQNQDQLNARLNKLKLIENEEEMFIDISAGVFIEFNDTITYYYGGNNDKYSAFYGAYFLQDHMLQYALNKKIKTYDFFGTRGNVTGHPAEEGVYSFKCGFDGYLVENIGYYEYKPKTTINAILNLVRKIRNNK